MAVNKILKENNFEKGKLKKMKKNYKKPLILFESMSLKATIAACSFEVIEGEGVVISDDLGYLFFENTVCERYEEGFVIEDGFCYHVAASPEQVYEEILTSGNEFYAS